MLLTVVVLVAVTAAAESVVDDGRWLQQLYTATGGGGWKSNCRSGWNTTPGFNPCYSWNGVYCNSNGRVSELYLPSCNLIGTLPELDSSTGGMSELQYLTLSSNHLSGTLPASLGSLLSLRVLLLYENQLSGTLPPLWSSLYSLQDMQLYTNQLVGSLPASWSGLHMLVNLSIFSNFISGDLPISWSRSGALTNLSSFDVHFNCLNLSSAQSDTPQWAWWRSKSSFGAGLLFQRESCYCGTGQLLTLSGYWCEDCPAGYYCPNTSSSVPCPIGTYNPSTGKSRASDACLSCPIGTTSNLTAQSSSRSCNMSSPFSANTSGIVEGRNAPSVTSTATAAVIAGLPVALISTAGSSGGLLLQRSMLQLMLSSSSSSCSSPLDEPLDAASSPTQLDVGGGAVGAFLRGAVVGNLLLLLGFGCVAAIATALLRRLRAPSLSHRSSRDSGRRSHGWSRAAAMLRLPGLLATPFLFLLQPTMDSSLSCMVAVSLAGDGVDAVSVAVGLLGCGVCAAGLLWCSMHVLWVGTACEAVPRRRPPRGNPSNCGAIVGAQDVVVEWLTTPSCEWRSSRFTNPYFVKQYGVLFEGYRRGRHWFLCVEMAITVACSVIGFLQSVPGVGDAAASCRALISGLLTVNVVALLCTVVLRPYQRGWDLLMFGASNTLAVAWGAVKLLVDDTSAAPEQLATAQVWLQVVQLGSALLETLWHLFAARYLQHSEKTLATITRSPMAPGRRSRKLKTIKTTCETTTTGMSPVPAPIHHHHQHIKSEWRAACEALIRMICEEQQQQQQQQVMIHGVTLQGLETPHPPLTVHSTSPQMRCRVVDAFLVG